ncbi:MAG TPA: ester cyclase [Propionibacteriaceae bacterium]
MTESLPGLVGSIRARESLTVEEARNLEVVREFLSLAGPGSADQRAHLLSDNFSLRRLGMLNLAEMAGLEDAGSKPHAGYDAMSFSDRRNVIEDMVAAADTVWVIFRMVGSHTGSFWGRSATWESLDLLEFAAFRLADEKIAEAWFMNDELAICRQLGIPVGLSLAADAE